MSYRVQACCFGKTIAAPLQTYLYRINFKCNRKKTKGTIISHNNQTTII